jgi:broad specificity phosphatase PhoE
MLSNPGPVCKHQPGIGLTPHLRIQHGRKPKNGVLSPVMRKIMIIRHAEKHQHGIHGHGVDEDGHPARHELTIRGWERAGALVRLFTLPPDGPIERPRTIFASNATRESPSLRAMHTAGPLAEALGLDVNHHFAEGEEERLGAAVLTAPSPVLIVWHHGCIARLAHKIAGMDIGCPGHWPDERFDLVWILERDAHGRWAFSQAAQCLLPGDCPDVI